MRIEQTENERCVVLRPIGDLDATSSIAMNEKIEQLLNKKKYNILIDCSELDYISSAGLGVFISHMDEIQEKKGKLIFTNQNSRVYSVFDLLGLNQLMTIVDTNETALNQI